MSAATRVELGVVIEANTGSAGTQLLEELLGRIAMEVVPVDAKLAGSTSPAVWVSCFGSPRNDVDLLFSLPDLCDRLRASRAGSQAQAEVWSGSRWARVGSALIGGDVVAVGADDRVEPLELGRVGAEELDQPASRWLEGFSVILVA